MPPSTAAKSRSQGREGWCLIFHHPLRNDEDGNPIRMRRGLGTRDDVLADRLVGQMNAILADETLWSLSARARAEATFDERVVKMFYDAMEPDAMDGWALREEVLPVPGQADGYARVLVLGATGAGKTTLVRQLIGSHPKRDRFPSTSTAKTTIADTEIILAEGDFEAVVSFFPRDRVQLYIEECVIAAVAAAAEYSSRAQVVERLLEHSEQRFRLSYLLGSAAEPPPDDEDDWGPPEQEVVEEEDEEETEAVEVGPEERAAMRAKLLGFIERIEALASKHRGALESALDIALDRLRPGDRDAFQELLEERLGVDAEAKALVVDILAQVETKVDLVWGGQFERRRGWPARWAMSTSDRDEFIRLINRFSSNYAPNFGRLLTPLVQGIRVRGPFRPTWLDGEDLPRLVLMDGEGLGHTSESSASLPTSITSKYALADAILLVDSATQPMMAAPTAVLRSVAATGHDPKLAIVFTHFDQVYGDNLRGVAAKREHVLRSLNNALHGLEGILGTMTVRGVRRNVESNVFFAASIHLHEFGTQASVQRFTVAELRQLLDFIQRAALPAAPLEVRPVYDTANLVLSVAGATQRFLRSWDGRLGVQPRAGIQTEHWTRIKALTRRLAKWNEDHYDNLMPVADLTRELQEGLANFIANPRDWEPANAPEEMKQAAIEAVRREAHTKFATLVASRVWLDRLRLWITAYEYKGTGSGRLRTRDLWSILTQAAPVPTEVPTPDDTRFLDDVRALFKSAVESAGGTVIHY